MYMDALKSDLVDDEGEVLHAYQDHLGYWTIGVGHLIDKRKGGGIPQRVSRLLLEIDMEEKTAELDRHVPWWRDMSEPRQRALANMAFQLGVGGLLTFSRMLTALKEGRYQDAHDEALNSKWAKQTPDRAKRVAGMLRGK